LQSCEYCTWNWIEYICIEHWELIGGWHHFPNLSWIWEREKAFECLEKFLLLYLEYKVIESRESYSTCIDNRLAGAVSNLRAE
jgi:hypothetical protein